MPAWIRIHASSDRAHRCVKLRPSHQRRTRHESGGRADRTGSVRRAGCDSDRGIHDLLTDLAAGTPQSTPRACVVEVGDPEVHDALLRLRGVRACPNWDWRLVTTLAKRLPLRGPLIARSTACGPPRLSPCASAARRFTIATGPATEVAGPEEGAGGRRGGVGPLRVLDAASVGWRRRRGRDLVGERRVEEVDDVVLGSLRVARDVLVVVDGADVLDRAAAGERLPMSSSPRTGGRDARANACRSLGLSGAGSRHRPGVALVRGPWPRATRSGGASSCRIRRPHRSASPNLSRAATGTSGRSPGDRPRSRRATEPLPSRARDVVHVGSGAHGDRAPGAAATPATARSTRSTVG